MKRTIFYTTVFASTCLLVTACATAPVPETETATTTETTEIQTALTTATTTTARTNRGGHSKGGFMDRYDTNGDGAVGYDEFMAERKVGYDRRDADSDGAVYEDEYVAEYEVRLEEQMKEQKERSINQAYVRFGFLDSDDDEIMTLDEFNASGERMFTRLDSNEDGVVNDEDTAERF